MKYSEIFSQIYQKNHWGSNESRSGPGSSLAQTEHIRRELPILIKRYNITSILDIPCGDFHWIKNINLRDIEYCGADIVEELIASNKVNYPEINFQKLDLLTDQLPRSDLVICRDCLFHFPLAMVKKALGNIYKSSSKFALITNHMWAAFPNTDINFGDYHRLNLTLEPFFLPPPLDIIIEGNTEANCIQVDRSLALWQTTHFQRFIND